MKIKIIITSTDSNKIANKLAEDLINKNLSPCIQITQDIQSIYKWQAEIKKSKEIMLSIKTIKENVEDCKKIILKHHNYEIPEILIMNGEILNNDYIEWFIGDCRKI